MDEEEGGLDLPVRETRPKKSRFYCRQAESVEIEAVFPAFVVLVSRTHVHLSNFLAAWEFDFGVKYQGLQEGLAYVFRATWRSETYILDGAERAYSMEQIFDPDVERYHFHESCRVSYGGYRHRWNAHNAVKFEVIARTGPETAGEFLGPLRGDSVRLAKKSGSNAGKWVLPRGTWTWREDD